VIAPALRPHPRGENISLTFNTPDFHVRRWLAGTVVGEQEERMTSFNASRSFRYLAVVWMTMGLVACKTLGGGAPEVQVSQEVAVAAAVSDPADLTYFPSSEPFRLGLQHFNRGNYGLAERYFRDTVEKDPKNAMAWIGLAGSYDHIGRFDLADRAYQMATRLSGETPQILNNRGYSYILRSQYLTARKYIMKAYARAPSDMTIASNVALIDSLAPRASR
jgi:tetratricopeptide (TPR) repeat protein